MSKEEEAVKTAEEQQEGLVPSQRKVALPANDYNLEKLAKSLKNKKKGIAITGEFLNLEAGEEFEGIILGITYVSPMQGDTESPDTDEKQKAILLMDEDQQIYMCANKVVVSTLEEIAGDVQKGEVAPELAAVHLVCTGDKKGKNNFTYKNFKISAMVDK